MDFYKILDNMMAEMKWRFEKSTGITIDFEFLSSHSLFVTPVEIFKKYVADLTRNSKLFFNFFFL